jgi:hypothetical protein
MPVIIIAGVDDRLIDTDRQYGRLHEAVGHSRMHQTATSSIMSAINEVAAALPAASP